MRFDSDLGDRGIVLDANGHWIPKPVSGDTETGVVVVLVQDENGAFVERDGHVLREARKYAAPLTVLPIQAGTYPFDESLKARPLCG